MFFILINLNSSLHQTGIPSYFDTYNNIQQRRQSIIEAFLILYHALSPLLLQKRIARTYLMPFSS